MSKRFFASLLALALFLLAGQALAQQVDENMAGVQNAPAEGLVASRAPATPDMDDRLARLHRDFTTFSRSWVVRLNQNSLFGRANLQVSRLSDGTYMATYREIDAETLVCVVKESRLRPGNFTGTLRYKEMVYECVGATEAEARNGQFSATRAIATREIFCLRNGSWYR